MLSSRATPAEIISLFAEISGGMAKSKDQQEVVTANAYITALQCRSGWILRKAADDILQGEAKDFGLTYMPTAPELSQYCKKREEAQLLKFTEIEKLLELPEEEKPFDTSKRADSAKIEALMSEFKAQGQAA